MFCADAKLAVSCTHSRVPSKLVLIKLCVAWYRARRFAEEQRRAVTERGSERYDVDVRGKRSATSREESSAAWRMPGDGGLLVIALLVIPAQKWCAMIYCDVTRNRAITSCGVRPSGWLMPGDDGLLA